MDDGEPKYVKGAVPYHPDDVWDSHPKYPREEWIHEVMSKDTNLGYWDWVNHQIEIDTYDD